MSKDNKIVGAKKEKSKLNVDYLKDLTPNVENNKDEYVEILNWAVAKNNSQIKNIALTGSYGSGKSSILKSFIKQYNEKSTQLENKKRKKFKWKVKNNDIKNEILEISVASFNSEYKKRIQKNEMDKENGKEIPSIENILEQYIMQRIFYRVSKDRIPLSRFSRIDNNKERNSFFVNSVFFLLTLVVLLFIKYDLIDYFIKELILNFNYKNIIYYLQLLLYMCAFVIFFGGLKVIREIIKDYKVNRVEVVGSAIELTPKESHSIFNKYIDEILYFFLCTDYRIVIFEDLDRFDSLEIFERLRDLNILLNNNEKLKDRNIVFIYALSDDIFSELDSLEEAQNRTKFFDLIIPTVKVVNFSNSEDILIDLLKDKKHSIDNSLIRGVSLYINDMRLLINICNEFHIMKATLGNKYLLDSGIFAISVYKNIYPKDYIRLLSNEGDLVEVFKKKGYFVKKITEEIKQLKKYITNLENEIANTIEELHHLFLWRKGFFNNHQTLEINLNNRVLNLKILSEFEEVIQYITKNRDELKKSGLRIRINPHYSWNTVTYDEFITSNGKYPDITISYNSLKIKEKNKKINIMKEIKQLEKDISIINSYSLKELYERYKDIVDSLLDEILGEKRLLRYLVTSGWIKENYSDYITYYYGEVLPPNDLEYIRSFFGGPSKGASHKLRNRSLILKKISGELIKCDEIFNYDFLSYIYLENLPQDQEAKKQLVIEYINENIEKTINFTNTYLEHFNDRDLIKAIFKNINLNLEEIWRVIERKSNFNKKREYVKLILESMDKQQLSALDHDNTFSTFISKTPLFLEWFIEPDSDWVNQFLELDIYIEELGSSNERYQHILDEIINHNLYILNEKNLKTILRNHLEISYKATQIHNSVLATRVNEEINHFVSILKLQEQYNEEEEYFIKILNNAKVADEEKEQLIKKWDGVISDTSQLTKQSIIDFVTELKKIKPTWNNILNYIFDKDVDEISNVLIEFIVENAETLKEQYIKLIFSDEQVEQLERLRLKTIQNNEISELDIEQVSFYLTSITFHNTHINERRVNTLINLELLKFDPKDYDYMQDNDFSENTLAMYLNLFIANEVKILNEVVLEDGPFKILLKTVNISNLKGVFKIGLNQEFTNIDFSVIETVLFRLQSDNLGYSDIVVDILGHKKVKDEVKLNLIYHHEKINIIIDLKTSNLIKSLMTEENAEKLITILLESAYVDDIVKKEIIETYVKKFDNIQSKIVDLIAIYYSKAGSINLELDDYYKLITSTDNEKSVAILLILGIEQFSIQGDQYEDLVGKLKTNHKLLSKKGGRGKEISKIPENERLMKLLKEKYRYISRYYNEDEEVIKFNVSRKFDKLKIYN